jgi:uncharacterized protein (TIGR03067 family)
MRIAIANSKVSVFIGKANEVSLMRLAMACAMTLGLSAASVVHAGDQEALQGSWRVSDARIRLDSGPALDFSQSHGTLVFIDDKVTMRDVGMGDSSVTFTFTLDTSVSPRRINLAGNAGFTWAGIYRITGDSVRVTLPVEHWNDRPVPPTDFGAPNTTTLILNRERR